jgi:hypothetical protein
LLPILERLLEAVKQNRDYFKIHYIDPYPELVRFVLFGEEGFNIYKKTLSGFCKVENWLS